MSKTMTDADPAAEPIERLAPYYGDLTHYAARVLGSRFEAEDAVQETMVRAWRGLDRFDGRSQLRTWLYRICTNVCLDMLASRQRRARPLAEASEHGFGVAGQRPAVAAMAADGDPADTVVARESVRFALLAVHRYLPPKQRAVLILREGLHWSASEIAELLDTSVASVNSALQRARATLRAARDRTTSVDVDHETRSRLDRYARAIESTDVETLAALVALEAA